MENIVTKLSPFPFQLIFSIYKLCKKVSNRFLLFNFAENQLLCDCRLRWVFDLRKKTKNDELRQSLQRIECYYDNKDPFGPHAIDNSLNARPNGPNDNGDYNEETEADLQRSGNVIQLLRFDEDQLPCTRQLSDPTELPLSRESIGIDLSWRSDIENNSSSTSSIVLVNTFSFPYICLSVFFVYFHTFH